jgi:LPS sulfotransferase NodH
MSVDSYFVCATPRTGSSLLLGLLESTGVGGRPQAYFRAPDEALWADRWGLRGGFDYGEYVRAARVAGSSPNGVFGAKLMWGTLDEVVEKLGAVHPELAGDDVALLSRAFGRTRFVFLRREDVLAQAVSWVRAEQTGRWFVSVSGSGSSSGGSSSGGSSFGGSSSGGEISGGHGNGRVPVFDAGAIGRFVDLIEEHNAAWEAWFGAWGIRPHVISYEKVDADNGAAIRGILGFLGIAPGGTPAVVARHRRQADALNQQWIDRYRALHK